MDKHFGKSSDYHKITIETALKYHIAVHPRSWHLQMDTIKDWQTVLKKMKTCVIEDQEKVALLFKINVVYHMKYIRQISKHSIMYLKYILALQGENLK